MTREGSDLQPELVLGPLRVNVHAYQFTSADNEWDANWLFATAQCAADGATVRVTGSFLSTSDLIGFAQQCEQLYQQLEGQALLEPLEPELRVALRYIDRAGHLEGRVQITPDHMTQQHQFVFTIDQSFLPKLAADCRAILAKFPARQIEKARGA
jgi:hypothetical protein